MENGDYRLVYRGEMVFPKPGGSSLEMLRKRTIAHDLDFYMWFFLYLEPTRSIPCPCIEHSSILIKSALTNSWPIEKVYIGFMLVWSSLPKWVSDVGDIEISLVDGFELKP